MQLTPHKCAIIVCGIIECHTFYVLLANKGMVFTTSHEYCLL